MTPMIYSLILPERPVVSASIQQFPMGVNPVACIDVMLTGTWAAGSAGLSPATVLSAFNSFRITRRGAAMYDVVARDAPVVGAMVCGYTPLWENGNNAAGARFALGFRMPLTRTVGNPDECLLATQRGDLLFEYNAVALPGTIGGMNISVMQLELPAAQPKSVVRSTTLQRTPTAVGDLDIDMPSGGMFLGATLFGTTVPVGTSNTKTITAARILWNNEEEQIVSSTWEHLVMMANARADDVLTLLDHTHVENTSAAYVQNALSNGPYSQASAFANYAYMDMDFLRDGNYALDLTGQGMGQVRITTGDTQPLRVVPHMLLDNGGLN